MDRVLVGVSGPRMRCAFRNLTPVAEMPQNPRAEPAGWLAQLSLLGLGLVGENRRLIDQLRVEVPPGEGCLVCIFYLRCGGS